MRELVLELMGEYGNLAVFLLILVENLFPPIPSEVILTFGGVMTVCTDMTPVGVILFSTAGSLAGAVILYSVGRFLPDEVFRKLLCGQIGHLLHFRLEDVDLAKGWFRERGRSAVFLCRLIPIVRSLISIPAGTAKMNMVRFALYTLVGSLAWNAILCTLGFWAGGAWEQVTAQAEWVSDVVKVVIVVVALAVIAWWVVKRIVPAMKEKDAAK